MDSLAAYELSRAAKRSGAKHKVFDWDRAAELIRERKPDMARAGLSSDWEYTGGEIYKEGNPVPREDTYVYLSSNWATPELEIDGDVIDCWKYEDETAGWDANTYWPESALAILQGRPRP